MPLSEYEQRVLDALERDLGGDPKAGRPIVRAPRSRVRILITAIGVVLGLTVLVLGAANNVPLLGVAGFAIMAASALWTLLAPSPSESSPKPSRTARAQKSRQNKDMMSKFEERFERRRDEGDL